MEKKKKLVGEYRCQSQDPDLVWLGVELGFFLSALLYGLFVIYLTWPMKNSESKYLLIAIYNLVRNTNFPLFNFSFLTEFLFFSFLFFSFFQLMIVGVLIPLVASVQADEETYDVIAIVSIDVGVASVILMICGPRLFDLMRQLSNMAIIRRREKSVSNSTSGGSPSSSPRSGVASDKEIRQTKGTM